VTRNTQASFTNFGDSFDLKLCHETLAIAYSQKFKNLFVFQEQNSGEVSTGSQKQLSLDAMLPKARSQQPPQQFSAMSLRQ
jgi:hypothetical protein